MSRNLERSSIFAASTDSGLDDRGEASWAIWLTAALFLASAVLAGVGIWEAIKALA